MSIFFKLYNDHYGHDQGDVALVGVAKTLKLHIQQDDLAIRFGGEEFVVLLVNADAESATDIADQILRHIREQKIEHQKSLIQDHLTVSIGLTVYSGSREIEYAEILKRADQALYFAKNSGA